MPDWNSDKLKPIKQLILNYCTFLNTNNKQIIEGCLTSTVTLARGKTVCGSQKVLAWLKEVLQTAPLKFNLIDATAALFNDDEAEAILYFEIDRDDSKEVFIETLYLRKVNETWLINRIFGLSLNTESHKRDFENSNQF